MHEQCSVQQCSVQPQRATDTPACPCRIQPAPELLKRTEEKREERKKERLEDYYRRNYEDYFRVRSSTCGTSWEPECRFLVVHPLCPSTPPPTHLPASSLLLAELAALGGQREPAGHPGLAGKGRGGGATPQRRGRGACTGAAVAPDGPLCSAALAGRHVLNIEAGVTSHRRPIRCKGVRHHKTGGAASRGAATSMGKAAKGSVLREKYRKGAVLVRGTQWRASVTRRAG